MKVLFVNLVYGTGSTGKIIADIMNLLKKYFKKPRYKKDNNVDVDKVYEALMKYRVTDKEKLKQHNANVKEMAKQKR